jgi:hypothetical protein
VKTVLSRTMLTLTLFPLVLFAQVTISSSVSSDKVGVGQVFQYSVSLKGQTNNPPKLTTMPDFGKLRVVSGPNESTSIQMINFNTTATRIYTWSLLAATEGEYVIRSGALTLAGKTQRAGDIKIIVSGQATPAAENVMLRAVPSRQNVYVGQQVFVEYELWYNVSVSGLSLVEEDNAGYWVEKIDLPERSEAREDTYKGNTYKVTTILRLVVYPSRSGTLPLPMRIISVDAVLPDANRSGRFNRLFNMPFDRQKRLTLTAGGPQLQVKDLPTGGKPEEFSGLIGVFTVRSQLNADTIDVNQPLTLEIQLKGRGNLHVFQPPQIAYANDLEVYPADKQFEQNLAMAKSGEVRWQQLIIPRVAGLHIIPAFNLAWFDPEAKKYVTAEQGPFAFFSRGDARLPDSQASFASRQVEAMRNEIRFIKTESEFMLRPVLRWYSQRFLLLITGGVLVIAAFIIWRRLVANLRREAEEIRRRQAGRAARRQLRKYERNPARELPDQLTQMHDILLNFLAAKLNQPLATIERKYLRQKLTAMGVDEEVMEKLFALLRVFEAGRYAPMAMTGAMSQNAEKELRQLIDALDRRI